MIHFLLKIERNSFEKKILDVSIKHKCPRQQHNSCTATICFCETQMQKQSQMKAKLSMSYILTHQPLDRVVSLKCEQSLDELTVQVCWLYVNPNLKYCTLYISGTEPPTDLSGRKCKNLTAFNLDPVPPQYGVGEVYATLQWSYNRSLITVLLFKHCNICKQNRKIDVCETLMPPSPTHT